MPRINDHSVMTHLMEVGVLTTLIIDLKKRELGREHTPITMERLDEATKAIGQIQQCRRKGLYVR